MVRKVLIVGGYGACGRRIARALAAEHDMHVLVGGRQMDKARDVCTAIRADLPDCVIDPVFVDFHTNLDEVLAEQKPALVIHAAGPFWGQGYTVAEACIAAGVHYIDIAEGRQFVSEISSLHAAAVRKQVMVISGASCVPGLASAVVDHFQCAFSSIQGIQYGVTYGGRSVGGPAHRATLAGGLGQPFKVWQHSQWQLAHGFQDLHRKRYPEFGKRWMAAWDVPDHVLFQERYGDAETIRFYCGVDSATMHLGLWALSWLGRATGVRLLPYARVLLAMLGALGKNRSGMHVVITGDDLNGEHLAQHWYLLADPGEGHGMVCLPAVIVAKKLLRGQVRGSGAMPCMGVLTLDEFVAESMAYGLVAFEG